MSGPRWSYSFAALPLLLACAGPWDDDGGASRGTRVAPPAPALAGSPGSQQPMPASTGSVNPPSPTGPNPPPTPAPGMTGATSCSPHDPGPWVLRRLSHDEYDNVVRDLTGYPRPSATEVAGEVWERREALPPITPTTTASYFRLAEAIAQHLIAGGGLRALAGCDAGEACARRLITGFAVRAYRRPLQPEEVAILEEAYRAGTADGEAEGLRAILLAVLQAPQFLYRLEVGQPRRDTESFLRLTPWETAARLSFHFWGSLPDAELAAAAEAGQLDSPEEIARQAERLAADPRARDRVRGWHRRWLWLSGLDDKEKDPLRFPLFTPPVRMDMRAEIERFLDDSFWDPGSSLQTLLTSPHTFVTGRLAAHYGISAPAGAGPQRVALDPSRHAGLLTRGPLMTMLADDQYSNPVYRGAYVLQNLLCEDLPPPPDTVPPDPPREVPANATIRERLEQHSTNPFCSGCHAQIDPIGFALESFDAVGRWRATDQGRPIDTSGRLEVLPDKPAFRDAVELSRLLAESSRTGDCMVRTWFELAFARRPDAKADACSVQTMQQRFTTGGQHLRDLFLAATETDAFRFRRPIPGGQP
jgi:hypothetical protein